MKVDRWVIALDVCIEDLGVFESAELHMTREEVCLRISHGCEELIIRMANWINRIDRTKFGELVKCDNAFMGDKRVNVNLSDAHLISFKCIDGALILGLNALQYSYNYDTNENVAEFILNDAGYEFVQDYYSTCLDRWENQMFNKPKRKDIPPHIIMYAKCFPRFFYKFINDTQKRKMDIEKVPMLEWRGFSDVELVKEYNTWVCLLASLFYHQDIDYVEGSICLNGMKTIIRRFITPKQYIKDPIFLHFNGINEVYLFLDNISFECFNEHNSLLKSIIYRYLQSTMLFGTSKYLLLYNVLEQCQEKNEIEEFDNLKEIHKKYSKLLTEVLPFVSPEEQSDFGKRWDSVWMFLKQKPYKGGLTEYLKKNNIDLNRLNFYLKQELQGKLFDVVSLRNCITHGGNVYVSSGVNDVLSFVVLILILRKIKCNISICNMLKYSDIYSRRDVYGK